jgi:hypothetical protein
MMESENVSLRLTSAQGIAIDSALAEAFRPVDVFFAILEDCQTSATKRQADWDMAGEIGRILMEHADKAFRKAIGLA